MMNSADVFEQIEKMGDLPSLPQTLLQIQTVAEDKNSSADDLAQCILKDQALTLRVLKVVNSALYKRGDGEKVRTVRRAVVVIGFETVRKLALGLSVFDMMSKLSRSPYLAQIARHSLITAGFAQILAEASGVVRPEEAFVAALVHDIGKVVLLECSPAAMDSVVLEVDAGTAGLDSERQHFGITHDRAGRRLAERWNLPPDIVTIIGDHHDIDPAHPPRKLDFLLAVIVYANAMSKFTCQPAQNSHEYKVLRKAGRVLHIPSARLEDIYLQVGDRLAELGRLVGMDLGELKDYGQVINVDGGVNVAPRCMGPEDIARRTADQLNLYRRVGEGLAAGDDLGTMLNQILTGAVDILGFERVVLLDINREQRCLAPRSWSGMGAEDLAPGLALPLTRGTGPLALAVLEHRSFHVPEARSEAYGKTAGGDVLEAAQCRGYAVAPVRTPVGMVGVLYADCGPNGDDVDAEQAAELTGLAHQIGLVMAAGLGVAV